MKDKSALRKIPLHRESDGASLLDRAQQLLVSLGNGQSGVEESVHPWRKDSRQIVLHTFRVLAYARRIMDSLVDRLTIQDRELIELAVVLHDIGKFHRIRQHAEKSAELALAWLLEVGAEMDTERLVRIIKGHSDKEAADEDFCSVILKDADLLDEIGAISIFMCANWIDKDSPFFFHQLSERLKNKEIDFCDGSLALLRTECAKGILLEKRRFIEGFAKQLDSELEGTMEYYKLMNEVEHES